MRLRFAFYLALALTGGFMLGATYAFAESTFVDISLFIGIVVAVVSAGVLYQALHEAPDVYRAIAGASMLIGAWTIVAVSVFSDPTAQWLSFASGGAFAALALLGLIRHELSTERVVHSLEVGERERTHEPVG